MQSQQSDVTPKTLITEANKPTCHRSKLIGIDLASGPDKTVFTNLNSAKVFADKARALLDKSDDMTICNAVNSIMTLALLNRKVLHIKVTYSPEVDGIRVDAFKANANYFGIYKPVLSCCVYLDQPPTLNQLQALEDDLIELIGSAKDKLMGAV